MDDQMTRLAVWELEANDKALRCLNALHALANPACDTPVQAEKAKIIWEAVKSALEAQGLSYASIISSQAHLSAKNERLMNRELI